MGFRTHQPSGSILIDKRMLEESHLELHAKDAADGFVYFVNRHHSFLHCIGQLCKSLCSQVGINAGIEGHHAGLLAVTGHMMGVPNHIDAIQVAHYKTAKAPPMAQYVGEQCFIRRSWCAIDSVVRGHHRECSGIDSFLERWQ